MEQKTDMVLSQPLSLSQTITDAFRNRNEEMALKLLAYPGIEIKNSLREAAEKGLFSVFEALLNHPDANLSGADGNGITVLHAACSQLGNVGIVRKIIAAAVIDIDVQDESGRTPLFWSVRSRRADLVETLLSAGADVGIAECSRGYNPFHVVASSRHPVDNCDVEITRLLCNHATQTRASVSPLYAEGEFGTPMSDAVFTKFCGVPAFEKDELVQIFLDAGYDVNHKEKVDNGSLLHLSVDSGNVATTKFLLDNGADCNATVDEGTPLHFAIWDFDDSRVFHEILLKFLECGVNLDLRGMTPPDMMYDTALNLALAYHKPNFAGLLVWYGSNSDSVRSGFPHIRAGMKSATEFVIIIKL